MAAARYWRVTGVTTRAGSDLGLSALHLYAGSGRADLGALLTSSHAPIAGDLANLQDSDETSICRFGGAQVRSSGFYLQWDFGAGAAGVVDGFRLGGASDIGVFLAQFDVSYSLDGAAWTGLSTVGRVVWPGVFGLTDVIAQPDYFFPQVALLLPFDGVDGAAVIKDKSPAPKTVTAVGGAKISTVQRKFGEASGVFNGLTDYLSVGHDSALEADGDITIEAWIRPDSVEGVRAIVSKRLLGQGYLIDYQLLLLSEVVYLDVGASGSLLSLTGTTPVLPGVWSFIAATKSGAVWRIYLNGNMEASGALPGPPTTSGGALNIGYSVAGDGNWRYAGYIDDLRITKGVARYAGHFTPPARAFPPYEWGPLESPSVQTPYISGPRVVASATVPAFSTPLAARMQLARDVEHGGPGAIYGTTKTKGTPNQPAKARVVLLHQRSKLPVRETWSDPVTGNFAFTGIDTTQQFLTLAEDAAGNFRPVAANRLTPEVLP